MPEIVRPLKTSVPELVIAQAVPVKVIVPSEGEKLLDVPLVSVPAILKLEEVDTVAELAVLRL